jgi:hypothetical protein
MKHACAGAHGHLPVVLAVLERPWRTFGQIDGTRRRCPISSPRSPNFLTKVDLNHLMNKIEGKVWTENHACTIFANKPTESGVLYLY